MSAATRGLSLVVGVLDLDETAHIVGSWVLMHGGRLYADFVDNKPPLLYVYYAGAQLVAGRSLIAVHLVTAILVVPLTAMAVSAFFRHTRTGVVAAFSFLLYSAAFLGHDMLATHAEIVMALPAAWALVLVRDDASVRSPWRSAGAGMLIGVAFLVKYLVGLWLLAPALAVLAGRGTPGRTFTRLRPLVFLAIGFAVPVAAASLALTRSGDASAWIYWTVIQNFHYAANPIAAREALGRLTAYLLPFAVVTAPLWWIASRTLREWPSRYERVLVGALLVTSVPAVLLGWRFFPHYFVEFYVPLAIASAPGISRRLWTRWTTGTRTLVAWTAVMLAGFTVANGWLYLTVNRVYRERDPVFRDVAQRLNADPCAPRATLFVWGYAPIIYYEARMAPASRFVVMSPARLTGYVSGNSDASRSTVEGQVVPEHWDWLMQDLSRTPPTFIVDTAPADIYRWGRYPLAEYPRLQDLVTRNYELLTTVDRVHLYRLRECDVSGR